MSTTIHDLHELEISGSLMTPVRVRAVRDGDRWITDDLGVEQILGSMSQYLHGDGRAFGYEWQEAADQYLIAHASSADPLGLVFAPWPAISDPLYGGGTDPRYAETFDQDLDDGPIAFTITEVTGQAYDDAAADEYPITAKDD